MKLETLIANEKSLGELAGVKLSSAQLAWDMAESLEVAQKHLKRFHDKRNELIRELGESSPENPEQYQIKDTKAFNAAINDLTSVEVNVTFPKIALTALNGAPVSPGEMLAWKSMGILSKDEGDGTAKKKKS